MTVDVAATNSDDTIRTRRFLLISHRAGVIFCYNGVIVVRYDNVSSGEATSRTRVGSSVDTLLKVDRALRFVAIFKFC
jgi:hypothetical protein